jgi:hypothetical protein
MPLVRKTFPPGAPFYQPNIIKAPRTAAAIAARTFTRNFAISVSSFKRAKMWNGAVIRTSSPEEHVRDLIEAGILTPLD